MDKEIVFCGIGGQGIVFSSNLIGQVAYYMGWQVKILDLMGLGQTGGSVLSHIKIKERPIVSPRIILGNADILVAFEKYEALRCLPYLKKEGMLLVNDFSLTPNSILYGLEPEIIKDKRKGWFFPEDFPRNRLVVIPGYKILEEHHINGICVNTLLIGMLLQTLGIELVDILGAIKCAKGMNSEILASIKLGYSYLKAGC